MAAPSLAVQCEQLFGRGKRASATVRTGRGDEKAGGAHQGHHDLTAAATAKLDVDAQVLHGADGQPRLSVSRATVMQKQRHMREHRPSAVAHQRIEKPIGTIHRDQAARGFPCRGRESGWLRNAATAAGESVDAGSDIQLRNNRSRLKPGRAGSRVLAIHPNFHNCDTPRASGDMPHELGIPTCRVTRENLPYLMNLRRLDAAPSPFRWQPHDHPDRGAGPRLCPIGLRHAPGRQRNGDRRQLDRRDGGKYRGA